MIKVDTDIALKSVNQLAEQLKKKQVGSAISRSINRTLTHERKVSRQLVRARYNMPVDTIDNFSVHTANPSSLTGTLSASSKAIPLHRFNPTFTSETYSAKIKRNKDGTTSKTVKERSGRRPRITGVQLTIIKGSKQTLNYAFISSGGLKPVFARGVYAGKGFAFSKQRLPITKLQTVSLFQAIAGQATREDLNKDSLSFYQKTFEHEIKYRISKATHNN